MKKTFNPLFIVGKVIHAIGMLLLFNFLFGLLFFPFFFWILIGITLLAVFMTALFIGKTILMQPFTRAEAQQRRKGTPDNNGVIDVEAEVVDEDRG